MFQSLWSQNSQKRVYSQKYPLEYSLFITVCPNFFYRFNYNNNKNKFMEETNVNNKNNRKIFYHYSLHLKLYIYDRNSRLY